MAFRKKKLRCVTIVDINLVNTQRPAYFSMFAHTYISCVAGFLSVSAVHWGYLLYGFVLTFLNALYMKVDTM